MKLTLPTNALRTLVKYAGVGTVEEHQPVDLQNLEDAMPIGSGGGGLVYKVTLDDKICALKVMYLNNQSTPEDQKMLFRREIALMRLVDYI